MKDNFFIAAIFFFGCTVVVVSYDDCTVGLQTVSCDYGCCGDNDEQTCCTESDTTYVDSAQTVWSIISSLFILVILAVIVSVVVAIFCCCRKSRGHAGQVIQVPFAIGPTDYDGASSPPITILTSNIRPGTVQPLQQSFAPPTYEEVA